jgi:hypothetical protein
LAINEGKGTITEQELAKSLTDKLQPITDFVSHQSSINHSFYGIASGTNTYAVTISNFSGLVDGANVRIKFTNGNTGACTLNINSLGAKSIKKPDGTDLASGDILAGQIVNLSYNGSVFQLISGGGDYVKVEFNNFIGNISLIHSNPIPLSVVRRYFAGATIGNYALFAGGYNYEGIAYYYSIVDAYDTSLIRSTPTQLSVVRSSLAGATIGNYALFAGGYTGSVRTNVVDAYDTSLTRSTPTPLSQARNSLAGASVGNYTLFAGGFTGSARSDVVDAYDTSLTRSTPTPLSQARENLAGASVGNYVLFAGGYTGSYSNVVDAYEPPKSINPYPISITAGSKYKLNSDTEVIATINTVILLSLPINGYIKYKKGVL